MPKIGIVVEEEDFIWQEDKESKDIRIITQFVSPNYH